MTRSPTRLAFTAVVALTLVSISGLSKVLTPRRSAHVGAPMPVTSGQPAADPWKGATLQREPVELSLPEDVREQCSGFALPPEPYPFEETTGTEHDLSALEGLAQCLRDGGLQGYRLELNGATEVPGVVEAPLEGPGAADAVRSALGRLGVPFSALETRDVSLGGPGDHSAPRVVAHAVPAIASEGSLP